MRSRPLSAFLSQLPSPATPSSPSAPGSSPATLLLKHTPPFQRLALNSSRSQLLPSWNQLCRQTLATALASSLPGLLRCGCGPSGLGPGIQGGPNCWAQAILLHRGRCCEMHQALESFRCPRGPDQDRRGASPRCFPVLSWVQMVINSAHRGSPCTTRSGVVSSQES